MGDKERRLDERIRQRAGLLEKKSDFFVPTEKKFSPTSPDMRKSDTNVRWDDPLRKINNIPLPKYFPPNRFDIPPGPRWDGIDRSNGFEASYLQDQNEKESKQHTLYLRDNLDL